ncbi:hypothetical protein [Streptomyces violaceusniger]|uniref:Uncharacterized protein n=1 Tax=Streptomyces violaceusniger (strain Tu 4113) TaxID=653045 RepID=G2PGU5_STRV4|nr:hypothetical protein [Streptomyces violaceusniger]AEM88659.1 hypothetical protein Strvi_9402 [Streptomyces violaceusniger Tu 4113]
MGGTAYWTKQIRRAGGRSPKEGATRRIDRLRGLLNDTDPAVADPVWKEVADTLQRTIDRHSKRGSAYWTNEIKQADKRSPKEGATKRLDRLRGVLQRVDPVVANRAWREVSDALQQITVRHTR